MKIHQFIRRDGYFRETGTRYVATRFVFVAKGVVESSVKISYLILNMREAVVLLYIMFTHFDCLCDKEGLEGT